MRSLNPRSSLLRTKRGLVEGDGGELGAWSGRLLLLLEEDGARCTPNSFVGVHSSSSSSSLLLLSLLSFFDSAGSSTMVRELLDVVLPEFKHPTPLPLFLGGDNI